MTSKGNNTKPLGTLKGNVQVILTGLCSEILFSYTIPTSSNSMEFYDCDSLPN